MQQRPFQRKNNAVAPVFGLFLAIFAVSIGASHAFAASGTIDAINKYAFSNIGGWVNFAPTHSTVSVTSSALTGYAWSANDGWINLSPTSGGVKNDGAGNLSGYAWDPSAGWVSFTGVTIDTTTGKFSGKATGNTIGAAVYTINFDCTNCDVVTDWRPTVASSNTTTTSSPGAISRVHISEPVSPPSIIQPASGGSIASTSAPTSATRGSGNQTPIAPGIPAIQTPDIRQSPQSASAPTLLRISSAERVITIIKTEIQRIISAIFRFFQAVIQSIVGYISSFLHRFF